MAEQEETEINKLFAARKSIMEHFQSKRAGLPANLEFFAKQQILGIIGSYEREALDRAEKGDFKNVAQVLAECDRKIDAEIGPFMGKTKLAK